MNNNNNSNRGNNNNRRRGRGNRQQQGGGNQNRIDSRARGNAPQMLDKYKKLAQDAQHHGDRVQAEYYLQFADHYFRVIADNRVRQEEPRGGRREERDFSNEEDGDEDDFGSARNARDDRPREERQRDDRPREDRQRDERPRDDRQRDDRPREDRPREDRQREDGQRDARGGKDRGRGAERQRRPREDNDGNREQAEGERAVEGDSAAAYEPAENPFVRPARERTARRPRTRATEGTDETEEMVGDRGEIDAAALPPSISAGSPVADTDGEAAPATRKLPPRRRRKVADEAGEGDNLTAVG
ncbi:DUF4167 domain-containing protein [Altererythrobacter sp. TH136]|uniref:DUF4167 domain-containing protein n=1 Tax=Altererythrobacter sp. TH136 TaxID=2067415 RepID=UPI001164F643|nr:DUF4167 domain-containing protein [Altererythrobacter sp. TH136]QDM41274.1 DUF4167 domain-containing protein [Altererythrobacter sp. TH136]